MVSVSSAGTAAVQAMQEIRRQGSLKFLSAFAKIPDKKAEGIRHPFTAWPVQRKIIERLTGQDVILKPAQVGASSILSCHFLFDAMYTPDTTVVIMAHKASVTERLLRRVKVVYDSIPDNIKPKVDHDSATELRFPGHNSIIYIVTAREEVAGRGEPIHRLLVSEAGFYPKDSFRDVVAPALQRVPVNGKVAYESTPNGEDELFYPAVRDCLDGKSDFNLQIIYWWENPDNWLEKGSPKVMEEDRYDFPYTEDEALLSTLHNLTQEQIRWRRWKIRQVGPLFWQEHIEDINTCFLTFGEPYYDKYRLVELAKACYPAPHSFMGAQVWFKPEPDAGYVIGIDPGQGKVSDSVASVWRDMGTHPRHEATLAGLIESTEMARLTKELGKYYNTALMVPEANAHGIGFTSQVTDYRRLYWRRDVVSGRPTNSIGWITSSKTKPFMMAELGRNLVNLETHDEVLVRQIGGFREVGVGKLPVTTGKDDHHDAACLALVGMSGGLPKARGYVGQAGWAW